VIPFPSTRIWPSLEVATAIVAPVAAGLAAGLGDGLADAAGDALLPHAAASNAAVAMAAANNSLDRTHSDTDPGYGELAYSGVT
jgi:hypothetical protein